jgi:repressor LexA
MLQPLTERQEAILDFIAGEIFGNLCPPTVREIGERFGIRSPNGVVCHLRAIEKKGFITVVGTQSRCIRLTDAAMELYE